MKIKIKYFWKFWRDLINTWKLMFELKTNFKLFLILFLDTNDFKLIILQIHIVDVGAG